MGFRVGEGRVREGKHIKRTREKSTLRYRGDRSDINTDSRERRRKMYNRYCSVFLF